MKTILFQGDSITDCGWNRNTNTHLETGYPCLIASELGRRYPGEYQFMNRAVCGNKVTDLIGRWKRDCIHLKPDYLSVLVGVNDVWHELSNHDGTDTKTFEQVYDILLRNTKEALPDTQIILLEPYVLENAQDEHVREAFRAGVADKRKAVKRLAERYSLVTIPLQDILNAATKEAPPCYWTMEGVHPTNAGHQIICDAWIDMFEKIKKSE